MVAGEPSFGNGIVKWHNQILTSPFYIGQSSEKSLGI